MYSSKGTQIPNHPELKENILQTQENGASFHESENSSSEKSTSPNGKIISENLTNNSQKFEANDKPRDAVNQIKHEVVTLVTNSSRSPLHKFKSSAIDELGSAGREMKSRPQARTNENLVTPRLQSKISAPTNADNQTKSEENISHDSLRAETENCEVATNKNQIDENYQNFAAINQKTVLTSRNKFAAPGERPFIQEQQPNIREPVKEISSTELESNKLEKAVISNNCPKFTDATFTCNTVQKCNAILQETYLIQNEKKQPSAKSESQSNEILKTPKPSKNSADISKLFEEACVISSSGKKNCRQITHCTLIWDFLNLFTWL